MNLTSPYNGGDDDNDGAQTTYEVVFQAKALFV